MGRYTSTSTLQNESGRRRKATTIFPIIPTNSQTDIYIRTTSIERLDKLAYRFYGDSDLWWIIATANGLGKGTVIVPTNTRLRIPSNTSVIDILNQTNRTR